MTELLLPDLAGKEAHLWPAVVAQLRTFAEEHFEELDPEHTSRMILARAIIGDPFLRLTVAVDADRMLGFAVATIERQGPSTWVYSLAGEIHGDDGTAAERYFQGLAAWGREHRATQILHATRRTPEAWRRKYGFVALRTMMSRAIPAGD